MNPNTDPNPPIVLPDQVIKVWAFTQNADGTLTPGSTGGGAPTDVNIKDISGSPVAASNPLWVELSDGTNPFGTPGNPLSVNVITGGGSNASVGLTGAVAPTSATEIGGKDDAGNLATVKIKPASTAALATDPSLVVQISPNQTSSNMLGTVPGTAPSATSIVGGKYNATPPAPTDGQTLPLQLNSIGSLVVAATITDPAEGVPGAASPTQAIQIGAANSLGKLTAAVSDALGNIKVTNGNPTELTVLQEILIEMRSLRRLMMIVYEESGEGNPAVLLDDSVLLGQEDYN